MDNEIVKNVELINKLPGLIKVKKEVKSLVDFLLTSKEREKEGLGTSATITNHLIFTGNPGTGKTTVARIIANIYRDLGLITEGRLIEITRSDLVFPGKGETAKVFVQSNWCECKDLENTTQCITSYLYKY